MVATCHSYWPNVGANQLSSRSIFGLKGKSGSLSIPEILGKGQVARHLALPLTVNDEYQ